MKTASMVMLSVSLYLCATTLVYADLWECRETPDGPVIFTNKPGGYSDCHKQAPRGGSVTQSPSSSTPSEGPNQGEQGTENPLAALPSDLVVKIQQLSQILQDNINRGRLSEQQIRRELQEGDLASVMKKLSPEAGQLFEEIKTKFKSSYTEDQLSLAVGALMKQLALTQTP